MSERRILVPSLAGHANLPPALDLDPALGRYLHSVLRRADGERIEVVPGDGRLLSATLRFVGRSTVRIEAMEEVLREDPRPPIVLAAAVIKGKRMDWLVEKAAEAGVDVLVPWEAGRSVVRLGDRKDAERRERWQAIMDGASRQCERLWRPEVRLPVSGLTAALDAATAGEGTVVIADEALRSTAFPTAAPPGPWTLVTGPEGGFTDEERATFLELPNALRVGLGRRMLRAETAALVLAARWAALVESAAP